MENTAETITAFFLIALNTLTKSNLIKVRWEVGEADINRLIVVSITLIVKNP